MKIEGGVSRTANANNLAYSLTSNNHQQQQMQSKIISSNQLQQQQQLRPGTSSQQNAIQAKQMISQQQ
jgi:hypothetical protein